MDFGGEHRQAEDLRDARLADVANGGEALEVATLPLGSNSSQSMARVIKCAIRGNRPIEYSILAPLHAPAITRGSVVFDAFLGL